MFLCGPSVRPSPGHRTEPVRANTNVFHVISGGALGTCWFWFHFVFFSCHILVFSFVSCLCLGFEPSSHACLLFILFYSFRVYAWYHGCFPGMLHLQVIGMVYHRSPLPFLRVLVLRCTYEVWSCNWLFPFIDTLFLASSVTKGYIWGKLANAIRTPSPSERFQRFCSSSRDFEF